MNYTPYSPANESRDVVRLQAVCTGKQFEEAIEYCRTTPWSVSQMAEYVMITGEIPSIFAAKYPNEIIRLARMGLLKDFLKELPASAAWLMSVLY